MSLPIPINENKSYFSRDAAGKFQPFVLELTTLAYTLDFCNKYKQIFWFVCVCVYVVFLNVFVYGGILLPPICAEPCTSPL